MPLITLDEVKTHLRVSDDVDNVKIEQLIGAAHLWAEVYLGRRVFPDAEALGTAVAAVPTDVQAATQAHDAAVVAAEALTDATASTMALTHACRTYQAAQQRAVATYDGIVINDGIREGMLVAITALYDGRAVGEIPKGAENLLHPWRRYG
jgi:Phage gp6-like head-tail connector protein